MREIMSRVWPEVNSTATGGVCTLAQAARSELLIRPGMTTSVKIRSTTAPSSNICIATSPLAAVST
ncbi:hypothetical protein D3C86_2176990 [compost metagenome]